MTKKKREKKSTAFVGHYRAFFCFVFW